MNVVVRIVVKMEQSFGTRNLSAILRTAACVVAASALSSCQPTASHDLPHQLLYIVDSDGNSAHSYERLFAVDPERKQIVKNYATGAHPDIALSPDGTRPYVASESRMPEGPEGAGAGRLDVIDTATGAIVASVADPNRWIAMGPLYGSEMALSADGHSVRIQVDAWSRARLRVSRDIRYCH